MRRKRKRRRAEDGEDPYSAAKRTVVEELAGQEFITSRISVCAPAGDGHVLYLFLANLKPQGEINLHRHSPELARLEWLSIERIRARSTVVPAFLEILSTLFPK